MWEFKNIFFPLILLSSDQHFIVREPAAFHCLSKQQALPSSSASSHIQLV